MACEGQGQGGTPSAAKKCNNTILLSFNKLVKAITNEIVSYLLGAILLSDNESRQSRLGQKCSDYKVGIARSCLAHGLAGTKLPLKADTQLERKAIMQVSSCLL